MHRDKAVTLTHVIRASLNLSAYALEQVCVPYWLCRALFARVTCAQFLHTYAEHTCHDLCENAVSPAASGLWIYMSVVFGVDFKMAAIYP